MKKRRRMILKTIAVLILLTGVSLIAYTAYEYKSGEKESEQLIEDFYERIEEKDDEQEEEEVPIPSSEQTSAEEETTRPSFEEGVIGIIEIESIGIRYPIIEGADSEALSKGIGHLPETAMIGEEGNCVLCGHNGSRSGVFFTQLNTVSVGDLVRIMDSEGVIHTYEIVNTRVVGPRENSIKDTDGTEKLTLFTCANKGTKRFVCDCVPKQ